MKLSRESSGSSDGRYVLVPPQLASGRSSETPGRSRAAIRIDTKSKDDKENKKISQTSSTRCLSGGHSGPGAPRPTYIPLMARRRGLLITISRSSPHPKLSALQNTWGHEGTHYGLRAFRPRSMQIELGPSRYPSNPPGHRSPERLSRIESSRQPAILIESWPQIGDILKPNTAPNNLSDWFRTRPRPKLIRKF